MTPGQEEVTSAYQTILDQGVLGAICVLLIAAIVWVVRKLLKSNEDRIKDHKSYAEALTKINDGVKGLVVEATKSAADTSSQVILSNTTTTARLDALERTNDELKEAIYLLRDEHIRQEAAEAARGRKHTRSST